MSFDIENGVLAKYNGSGGDVVIPDGVTAIGVNAFRCCEGLRSVVIPAGVARIERDAFRDCEALTSVDFSYGVAVLAEWAFAFCEALTAVTLPEGLAAIGLQAFRGCTSLTTVKIPDSVTEIKSGAFRDCAALTSVTLPARFREGLVDMFDEAIAARDIFTFTEGEAAPVPFEIAGGRLYRYRGNEPTVTVPEGVRAIGKHAFADSKGTKTVRLPSTLTMIEANAFGHSSVTALTIPEGVTTIGDHAFFLCAELAEVSIPASVTDIGERPFFLCRSLRSLTLPRRFEGALDGILDRVSADGCRVSFID